MKRIRLNTLSILLSLSVISLLIIQSFQMIQLYDRKDSQFNQNANDCLKRIAFHHEKAEDLRRYLQIVNRDFSGQYREILKDEFKEILSAQETISIRDTTVIFNGKREKYLILNGDAYDSLSGISAQQRVLIRDVREIKDLMESKGDTSKIAIELNQKVLQQIFTKAKFINDMMIQAFRDNIYENPAMRIVPYYLDSIIRYELSKEDLPKEYQFMVCNQNKAPIKLSAIVSNYNNKLDSVNCINVNLFPSNSLDENLYLYVYFPQKQQFIYKEMKNSFIVTGLLVVIIIVVLIIMFRTILEQKKLSELKSDFISNMTHEFKTPISTISLACEAATDKDVVGINETHKKLDPYFNMIKTENKRLELLVESILQSAVIDKGEIRYNIADVNLNELVHDLVKNVEFRIQSVSGKVVVKEHNTQCIIKSDKIHLTNLVANILDNAVKYSKEIPDIEIIITDDNNLVALSVSDKGIGIQKEFVPKVFDKLFRVPTGNIHNVKGFGLGLSYVKSICDTYGWNIEIKTQYGEGTTIKVIFNTSKNAGKIKHLIS
jgi:two-component system phosphate regulon sensor histidine kinase PhoR